MQQRMCALETLFGDLYAILTILEKALLEYKSKTPSTPL